jgi:uncharacterized membrane protein YbaN (DUF454 family)
VNVQDAKKILLRWRPGHGDLRDPEVSEALELARHEPALQQWLDKQRSFQRAVEQSFREVPVPPDLRRQLLAQRRISRPHAFWQRPVTWAAAAGLVLFLSLLSQWMKPPRVNSFDVFRDRTVRNAQRTYPAMGIVTNDAQAIRRWLASKNAPSDYVLPKGLEALPLIGAGSDSWQGKGVSMVCLDSASPEGTLFLFILDARSVRNPPPEMSSSPEFVRVFQMMTASWTSRGKVYLLAGHGGMEALHRFL